MNILGIGAEELILIIIIMVIVAGPKRMIQWSYTLGKYLAQFRKMLDETWAAVRKEFEAAQVDLPKDIPTRGKTTTILRDAMKPVTEEFERIDKEAQMAVAPIKSAINAPIVPPTSTNGSASSTNTAGNTAANAPTNGTASGAASATKSSQPEDSSGQTEKKSDDEQPRYDSWLPN